ncbi:unnamed protein product [Didymodactylos carnosus]|uniref:Uncharacterized protein n=2 Tax=Didymodactylos carnosus TaxID=1234261 RepID=A0A8S2LKK3_9BILA|nr:unnamed protein product [Didymodactylos carnosus]CAF3911550.1 unnamed protein product [Didymodactylos carnosus]
MIKPKRKISLLSTKGKSRLDELLITAIVKDVLSFNDISKPGLLKFITKSIPEIPDAFDEVKAILPSDAEPIIQWFENNYVHGRVKRRLRNGRVQRHNPLYPPEMWSVFDNMKFAFPRTENKVEAWHRRWEILIGRAHVGIFTMIKQIQKEQNEAEMEIEKSMRGEPAPKKRKEDENRESRIQNVIADRVNRSTIDFLRGIDFKYLSAK